MCAQHSVLSRTTDHTRGPLEAATYHSAIEGESRAVVIARREEWGRAGGGDQAEDDDRDKECCGNTHTAYPLLHGSVWSSMDGEGG